MGLIEEHRGWELENFVCELDRRARVGQCGVGNSEIFEELCATCGRVDTKLLNADESYLIAVLLIRGLEIGQFGFARRARWEPAPVCLRSVRD